MNTTDERPVPITDEVEGTLSSYTDKTLRVAALGLYDCYRKGRDLSVAEAYKKVLRGIIGDWL